jgi:hypothetical protein
MLEIWLLARNYSKKGMPIALAMNKAKTIFFIKLLDTLSKPFAIIIAPGNNKNNNSELFLFGINKAKNNPVRKLIMSRIQLFLKELFTENTFSDFKNIAAIERANTISTIQWYVFFELKTKLSSVSK